MLGKNDLGQLGTNTTADLYHSVASLIGNTSWTSVTLGGSSGMAIKGSDGSGWSWGSNTQGQLGDNTTTNRSSPVSIVGGHSFVWIAGMGSNSLGGFAVDGADGSGCLTQVFAVQ